MGFDWTGAVTFAHGTWMGPPRVLCAIGAVIIGSTIASLLCALLVFATSILPEEWTGIGLFISSVASFAMQIWGISLSMAIYEYWRGLEPMDPNQKRAEAGLMSKEEEAKLAKNIAQKTDEPSAPSQL